MPATRWCQCISTPEAEVTTVQRGQLLLGAFRTVWPLDIITTYIAYRSARNNGREMKSSVIVPLCKSLSLS